MAPVRSLKDAEKTRWRLNCVNRLCQDGEHMMPAMEMVCQYYCINYKTGKMVCKTCLKKSLSHYKRAETLIKEEKCAMECNFPNFGRHIVIDSSSEDEMDPVSDLKSLDNETDNCLSKVVDSFFKKNKYLIEKQTTLCDEYLKKKIECADKKVTEIDNCLLFIENDFEDLRKSLYEPYKPILRNDSCVELDEFVGIENKNNLDTTRTKKKKNNKSNDKHPGQNKTDKDSIITVDLTRCNVPADLPKEGQLVYPVVNAEDSVYGMMNTATKIWVKCKVLNTISNGFLLVSFGDEHKLMNSEDLAYYSQSPVRFQVGNRVIGKYTDPSGTSCLKTEHFYVGIIAEPPTVLNEFRYLIFYDDGRVQYRHHKDIRLVIYKAKEVWKCVKLGQNSDGYKKFLQRYLDNYPDRHMVRLANTHNITAQCDGKWMGAKVMEVYASLVRLYFVESKKIEWLYRGSPRLRNIHDKLKGVRMRQSGLEYLNKPYVEFTTIQEETKAEKLVKKNLEDHSPVAATKTLVPKNTTECPRTLPSTELTSSKGLTNNRSRYEIVTLELPKNALKPKSYVYHECNSSCVSWTEYDYNKTKNINVLAIPAHYGFIRKVFEWEYYDNGPGVKCAIPPVKNYKCVMYISPCGRIIRTMKEMLSYLIVTESKMTIELFDFNSWVNPMTKFKVLSCIKYISDITLGREFKKISCVNTLNNKYPPAMSYITSKQPMPGVHVNTDPNFLCGCDCTDNCQDKSKCACWQLTIKNQNLIPVNGNEYDPNIGYHYRRLPERVLTGIYECNSTCKCSSTCLNRVVQHPLSQKLQLFMTEKKGWGVRCLNDIPSGSFICIYVGFLLTESDANHGGLNYGDEYLAELDYIEVVEKTKQGYEESVQQLSDEEKNDDKDGGCETSDEDYQAPSEKNNTVGSDIISRLRKRVRKEVVVKKKTRGKKDSKPVVQSPSKQRVLSPKRRKSVRDYYGEGEKVFIMDAKTSGNIGRYINHSCSPNIFVQNVFVDTHDIRFPWISFFALHYIPAGTELTWDYSYDIGSVEGKSMMCYCESVQCRRRLL